MQGIKTVALMCAALACAVAHAAEEPSAPAQYDFTYAVNDPTTGDQKDQQETRNGDDVTGYYRTLDSDGFVRTVKYRADAVNGFTAEVIREPTGAPVATVPVVAKAVAKPAVAAVPVVAPAPYVAPVAPVAPYYFGSSAYPYNFGSSAYPYSYQPYSYGYQSYPYSAYAPYSYGPYPFSSRYTAPVVRK